MTSPSAMEGWYPALNELGRRFDLGRGMIEQLGRLVILLADDPAAPTTIRDPRRVVEDHIADSLIALERSEVRGARRVADLGAGAGLPGLCLALALPDATVSLVESNGRKAMFLERAGDELALTNVQVVNLRAEEWREGQETCDLVTARALAAPDIVMEYAAPLLAPGGALVAWRGQREPALERRADRAAAELGLELRELVQVHPYPSAVHRHLLVAIKVRPTPSRFPRRPGVATKRPLGR